MPEWPDEYPKYEVDGGQLSIQHLQVQGQTVMPRPHSHHTGELYYLHDGERIYFVDDQVITLRKGELMLIPPGETHSTASSTGFARTLLNYDVRWLPPELAGDELVPEGRRFRLYQLSLKEQEETERLLHRMLEECRNGKAHHELSVRALFTELLILLLRAERQELPREAAHPLHDKVNEIAAYLASHFRQSLTLEDTARRFYISSSYLSRTFYRLTGFHFREYIIHLRIREAKRRLSSTRESIQEVAAAAGFEYLSHFNKTFKKETGQTPLQYRKQADCEGG